MRPELTLAVLLLKRREQSKVFPTVALDIPKFRVSFPYKNVSSPDKRSSPFLPLSSFTSNPFPLRQSRFYGKREKRGGENYMCNFFFFFRRRRRNISSSSLTPSRLPVVGARVVLLGESRRVFPFQKVLHGKQLGLGMLCFLLIYLQYYLCQQICFLTNMLLKYSC